MLSSWQNLGPSWKQRRRSRITPYMLRRRLRCTWEDEYWAARTEGKVSFLPVVQSLRVKYTAIGRHFCHDNYQWNRRMFVFAIPGPRSVRSSVTEQWAWLRKTILKPAVSNKVFIIIYYHLIMHGTTVQTRARTLFCFTILRTMACLTEIFSTTHIDPGFRVPCFSTLRKPQHWGIALISAGNWFLPKVSVFPVIGKVYESMTRIPQKVYRVFYCCEIV